jgi:formylglycine-generating enzyme required for sulfatase activity
MHGNAWEWCQDRYKGLRTKGGKEAKGVEDKEDKLSVNDKESRVLRGGSFDNQPVYVRSANRYWYVPTLRYANVGFRPARTFPAE